MELLAFVAPILPGKTEQWKQFVGELNGARRNDYLSSRRSVGVRERAFLQETPQGDMVIVTLEGDNPAESLRRFASSTDAFGKWFAEQVRQIHGIDLQQMSTMPFPKLLVDSQQARAAGY